MRRFVNLIDVAALAVAAFAVLLPPREMLASDAQRSALNRDATPEQRFALSLAEARSLAHPEDGVASAELSHRLSEANYHDWAIEEAVRGSERAKGQPMRWLALFTAAEAYVDQYEAAKGLDFAESAMSACESAPETACHEWDKTRMDFYRKQLDAGVKSGIDPRKEPIKFRAAGERGLRGARIHGHEAELQPGAPAPGSGAEPRGSGAAGSSAP